MYSIQAVLRLISPMHITAPGDFKVRLPGAAPNSSQFPLQSVTKLKLIPMLDDAIMTEFAGDDAEGGVGSRGRVIIPSVPVIPANNVRGRLRRECAAAVFDLLVARDEKITLGAYNSMVCGAVTGRPDSALPTLSEIREVSAHPFLGLFGGGPRLHRSSLEIETMLPICEQTLPFIPQFEDMAAGINAPRDLIQVLWRRRNDDVLSFAAPTYMEATIENYLEAIDAYQSALFEQEVEGEEKARGVRSFTAYEVVNPGTPFAFGARIKGGLASVGLFLEGLQRFARTQSIGGMSRIGYGRFEMIGAALIGDDGIPHRIFADSLASKPTALRYGLADSGLTHEAVAAWEAAKASITAADIERLMKPADAVSTKSNKAKK